MSTLSWKRMAPLILLVAGLAAIATGPMLGEARGQAPAPRRPIPAKAAQDAALASIKEVFAAEYAATKMEAKVALSQKLLETAKQEKDSPSRFVLYREAVRLASENGSLSALDIAGGMAGDFEVSPLSVRQFALTNLCKSVPEKDKAGCEAILDQSIAMADELGNENRFEEARKLLLDAGAVVRRLRNTARSQVHSQATQRIEQAAKAFEGVKESLAVLKTNPADPAANLAVGKFECFEKGNWPTGLAHLAKGSDPDLKKGAEQTLADPKNPEAQFAVAGLWWKTGEALGKGAPRQRTLEFASAWYAKSLPGLSGLSKATAEKRLAEVKPKGSTTVASGTKTPPAAGKKINLLSLLQPEDFLPREKWRVANGVLECTEGNFVPKVAFPYQPGTEYDVAFTFSQPRLRNGVGLILPNPNGGKSFIFQAAFEGGSAFKLVQAEDKYVTRAAGMFRADTKYQAVVRVRKEGIQVAINGKGVINLKTDFTELENSSWHKIPDWRHIGLFADDPAVFYQAELLEVTGEGTLTREGK